MFGSPSPLCPRIKPKALAEISDLTLLKLVQALQQTQDGLISLIQHIYKLPTLKTSQLQAGDQIWVRCHQKESLQPYWEGPVILLSWPPSCR